MQEREWATQHNTIYVKFLKPINKTIYILQEQILKNAH